MLNRLGIDSLHLLGGGTPRKLSDLTPETARYFQKLPGYDTLRMVLARKLVLLEGPSDEIIFERIFKDKYGKRPMSLGIDVLSMRGLSFRRGLELCAVLDKTVAVIRDNDGTAPEELAKPLESWLKKSKRELFIGSPELGNTLEPQLTHHNEEEHLRKILGIKEQADLAVWMKREKTETALRIAEAQENITPPKYMIDAAVFIHG